VFFFLDRSTYKVYSIHEKVYMNTYMRSRMYALVYIKCNSNVTSFTGLHPSKQISKACLDVSAG
jgi:hypothetical protein